VRHRRAHHGAVCAPSLRERRDADERVARVSDGGVCEHPLDLLLNGRREVSVIVIVTAASTPNASTQSMPAASDAPTGNASVNRRNATTKPAAFEADERNALTGAGAPSYASGAQERDGTEVVLNATPPRIITIPSPATPARPSSEPIPGDVVTE